MDGSTVQRNGVGTRQARVKVARDSERSPRSRLLASTMVSDTDVRVPESMELQRVINHVIPARQRAFKLTEDNPGSSVAPAKHLGLGLAWECTFSPGPVCIASDLLYQVENTTSIHESEAVAPTTLLQEWLGKP